MNARTRTKHGTHGQSTSCPIISALALGLAALLGSFAPCLTTPAQAQIMVYDLDEINGDLRILGAETNDFLGHEDRVAVFDFNDNGMNDLFFIRGNFANYGSVYGVFDFDFEQPNTVIDTRDFEPDLYIPYNPVDYNLDHLINADLNGDGLEDLVTSNMWPRNGNSKVYVVYGSADWQPGTTIDFTTEPADLTIRYGNADSVHFGESMTRGDLNHDGIDDLIIGAINAENPVAYYWGAVYVVFGSTDFPPEAVIDFSVTPADITFYGAGGDNGGNFGYDVASGDVNGDGIDDLLVGAIDADATDSRGRVYVFYGSESFPPQHVVDLMQDEADVTVVGPNENSNLGRTVACGDINGDGFDDICGGGDGVMSPDDILTGGAYLFYGRSDFQPFTVIDLALQPADITCYGEMQYSTLGFAMDTGDMDNDGFDEWIINARRSQNTPNEEGIVYILQGSDRYPANHVIDFAEQDPMAAVYGDDEEDYLNFSGEMTDVNQDGLVDLVLGAYHATRQGYRDCGEAYVILSRGPVNAPPRLVAGPGPGPGNGVEVRLFDPRNTSSWWSRFEPYDLSGYGANVAAGDLDGDGYDEVITGPGPGPVHPPLVAGFSPGGERLFEFPAYGVPKYGVNVTAGDVDGDGIDEIITGAGPGPVYGPHFRGWRWQGGSSATPVAGLSVLAYGTNRWGVNVAVGDIDGDGRDEIVTGAGPGQVFGPHLRAWRYDGVGTVPLQDVSFFTYGTLKWGVNVACGDIDGDGIDELVTGPGPGIEFGSHVRAFDYDGSEVTAVPGVSFFAYPALPQGFGAVVACGDVDNDRVAEIITAPGPHPEYPAWIKTWNYDGDELVLLEDMSVLAFEDESFTSGARPAFGNFFLDPPYLP